MKAAVVHQFGADLVIEDRAIPKPAPGEVLVRVEYSGLCHTDIHAARGDWPVKPTPPFVPGHEGVGIIDQVGDGVAPSRIGVTSRAAMARLRVWQLPTLHRRVGNLVRAAAQHRVLHGRQLRRVRRRVSGLRHTRSRRRQLA